MHIDARGVTSDWTLTVWIIGKCNIKTMLHWELCMKGDIKTSETDGQS